VVTSILTTVIPPINTGEMLGIYELEIKHLKQFRDSSTLKISLATLTLTLTVTLNA
jgi:hypothetical protein